MDTGGLVNPDDPTTAPSDCFLRKVDYLRISITDRCNERCLYCMPEGLKDWRERAEILTYEEILLVTRAAVSLGFRKFRVTGGEPLVRKNVESFLVRLAALPGVQQLGLSTNGTLLAPMARTLQRAGIKSVNFSLDSLDLAVYQRLTSWPLHD